ncbi:hypothetical protein BOX15_Mlig020731g3 [Macrostomum lignano]|uniref:Tetraspanin n=3 Tax=Macrostomum lignano TaxID=282301 RepID=A0A267FTC4_9PLAT|nr:hypothetical protein BOX15_Mlig020731g3 [Macrostomum lignano]
MCHCINKLVLVIVNIVFLLAGAAIVGVSIWVIVSADSMFKLVHLATQGSDNINNETLMSYKSSTSTLVAAAYVILVFGALSFLIGFCGCCGAIRESSCLLSIYAGAVSIVLIVEIAGGIAAGVFRAQIGTEMLPTLKRLEATRYLPINLAVSNDSNPNAVFSSLVNYAQVSMSCCGVSSMSDITGVNTLWTNSSRQYNGKTIVVPVTCCKMNKKDELLSHQNWTRIDDYLIDRNCPYNASSSQINKEGCYDKLNSYIDRYTLAIIVVGILVGMFEIICVVMACSMVQKIRSERQNV